MRKITKDEEEVREAKFLSIVKKIIVKTIAEKIIVKKKIIVNEIKKDEEELSCQALNNWNIS